MLSDADLAHLDEAVALAERGLYTTTPNPRVGCVLVRDGVVLGRGWHQWRGEAHAEVRALEDAGGDAAGATAYVSLEPCCVQGRTPPCVDALIAAKVRRVVAGALDNDPRVNGGGLRQLAAAGIAAELAEHEAAQALNAPLRHRLANGRPWLRIKMAGSLDGRAAMASGESQWITGTEARRDAQHWRARSCAVLTGIGTLLADDPLLNVRDHRFAADGRLRQPLRVVVDSRLRTPPTAKLFQQAGPVLVAVAGLPAAEPLQAEAAEPGEALAQAQVAHRGELPAQAENVPCGHGGVETAVPERQAEAEADRRGEWSAQAEIVPCGPGGAEAAAAEHQAGAEAEKVSLERLLDLLGARPCNEVLVEAGPTLAGAFIAAGLWDEMLLYLAPKMLGASARPLFGLTLERLQDAVRGRILDVESFGPDLRVRLARA